MSDELIFQRRLGGVSFELTDEDGAIRATITYPYPDPQYERGGFPRIAWVLSELGVRLGRRDGLRVAFLAELLPCASEEVPPDHPLPLDPVMDWLEAQRAGTLGVIDPARGYWLGAQEALGALRRLTEPLTEASAEASRVRMVLLESETPGARGWDLVHRDGITTLGRFRVELDDEPAPLDPEDVEPTRALLGEVADLLAPRLGNGKASAPHGLS